MNYKQLQSGFFEIKTFEGPTNTDHKLELDTYTKWERKIAYHRERKVFGPYQPDSLNPILKIVSGATGPAGSHGRCLSGGETGYIPQEGSKLISSCHSHTGYLQNGNMNRNVPIISSDIESFFNTHIGDTAKYTHIPFKESENLDFDIKVTRMKIKYRLEFASQVEACDKYMSIEQEIGQLLTKLSADPDSLVSYELYGIGLWDETLSYTVSANVIISVLHHSESPFNLDLNWLRRKDTVLPLIKSMNSSENEINTIGEMIKTLPGNCINKIISYL
jgi:hypothetical protein